MLGGGNGIHPKWENLTNNTQQNHFLSSCYNSQYHSHITPLSLSLSLLKTNVTCFTTTPLFILLYPPHSHLCLFILPTSTIRNTKPVLLIHSFFHNNQILFCFLSILIISCLSFIHPTSISFFHIHFISFIPYISSISINSLFLSFLLFHTLLQIINCQIEQPFQTPITTIQSIIPSFPLPLCVSFLINTCVMVSLPSTNTNDVL